MNKNINILVGLMFILTALSCQKDNISIQTNKVRPLPKMTLVRDYFPLKKGNYWVYTHTYKDKSTSATIGTDVWYVMKDSLKFGITKNIYQLIFATDSNFTSPSKQFSYYSINEDGGYLYLMDINFGFTYSLISLFDASAYSRNTITTNGVPLSKGYFYNIYNPVQNFTSKFGSIETIKSSIDSLGGSGNTVNEYTFKKTYFNYSKNIGPTRIMEIFVNKRLFMSKPDTIFNQWDLIRYNIQQ